MKDLKIDSESLLSVKFFNFVFVFLFYSLAGGILYGYLNGYDKDTCIKAGLLGAYKSLKATSAISDEIEPSLLTYEAVQKWANFNPRSLFDSS